MARRNCNVLLVYPRFDYPSYWELKAIYGILGKRAMQPPLGLLTVAALLPTEWSLRLVDRNTDELSDADLDWADLVMTGGMIAQRPDLLAVVDLARGCGKPVVVGGPDVTTSPEAFERADFRVLGEAETVIDDFVAAWEAGERRGVFEAVRYKTDVTRTPPPRYDLVDVDRYALLGLQFSRGRPFTCEFCDIIEIYGRMPRTKTTEQMLAELDGLLATGYRGTVLFVDDNLIGNKKAVKAFLPHLKAWLEKHGYPFDFATEASLNLADDPDLLGLLRDTNFGSIFVGIESPDEDVLTATRKKQNTRRDMVDSVRRIYAAGLNIAAGFIIGFDSEKSSVAGPMIRAIRDLSIPVAMVGLLTALPQTQLWRRLERENRLDARVAGMAGASFGNSDGDNCAAGLNFAPARDRRDILTDYRDVLADIYYPKAYFGRARALMRLIRRPHLPSKVHPSLVVKDLKTLLRTIGYLAFRRPDLVPGFVRIMAECAVINPAALKPIFSILMIYLHLDPFARSIVADLDREIAALGTEAVAEAA